ncbi:MAG: STAS domain-containing protein [Ruminococcaceae bacterium]|nr:STAS domain-containing protein [Oscillospiraceae bacterium]
MEINSIKDGGRLTITVSGRVDTVTAPDLEKKILESLDGTDELILDLKDMPYTSSAGLRVLLKVHKEMSAKGGMKLTNVCDDVMEVLEVTGFSDILTIE